MKRNESRELPSERERSVKDEEEKRTENGLLERERGGEGEYGRRTVAMTSNKMEDPVSNVTTK